MSSKNQSSQLRAIHPQPTRCEPAPLRAIHTDMTKPVKRPHFKTGRKSVRSLELADKICQQLANGKSLNEILKNPEMPGYATITAWLRDDPLFQAKYAQAREDQADKLAAEIVEIADTAKDSDSAAAARVRVDARKWVASKLKPKVYGDKVDVTTAVDLKVVPDDRLEARFAELLGKVGIAGAGRGTQAPAVEAEAVDLLSSDWPAEA